jgi:hypothetical protein
MKKIIAILLVVVSLNASAQPISLTLPGKDWAWLIGKNKNSIISDSASAAEFRSIRNQIQAIVPAPGYETNITINNLPEWVVMAFYRTVKTSNGGEIDNRYTTITTAIQAKTQLTTQITAFNNRLRNTDPGIDSDYERAVNDGKTMVFDQ